MKFLLDANLSYRLVIDDTLKTRSTSAPLFEKKIERATQIMARVRAKQAEQQKTQ